MYSCLHRVLFTVMLSPGFVFVLVSVQLINGLNVGERSQVKRDVSSQIDNEEKSFRTPTNIRIRAGEDTLEIYWTPPEDSQNADFCAIEYKESPLWSEPSPLSITLPFEKSREHQVISGLQSDTRYGLRMHCFYGNVRGRPTDWFYASTRTVSEEQNICPGTIPNAFLEPSCLESPRTSWCAYTCENGYRINDVPAALNKNPLWGDDIYIFCRNGSWITNMENHGHHIDEICLPEAAFEKCPASIPNGKLQKHCGPATDWLCEFECDPDYQEHPFIGGRLKGFNNKPDKLLCGEDGIWKTGYEDLGVDITGLCFPMDENCTADIPHGTVYTPCQSGYSCKLTCDEGYRLQALAADYWMSCLNGDWALSAAKYDQSITPQTVCVPEASYSNCPRNIPNGHIPADCTDNCWPVCNDGYRVIGGAYESMAPNKVTCENGQWLTESEPYTGENICYPEDGMRCPPEILNGYFTDRPESLTDFVNGRQYTFYRCNEGYRKHRGVPYLECIAGKWLTWNERHGIDTNALCIPIDENLG